MTDNDDTGVSPTLLLTRPRAAAARFALAAAARWPDATVVVAPLMEVVVHGDLPSVEAFDGFIFTSGNAVARSGPGHGKPAWCVGARTAHAAKEAGFDAVMAGETADELVDRLARSRPHGRILHMHGVHQRGDVVQRLAQAGLSVEGMAIYDQRAVAPDSAFFDALAAPLLFVPLFSPRSASLFVEAAGGVLGDSLRDGIRIVALSDAVRDALPRGWHEATSVAPRPDADAMLDEIAQWIFP